MTLKEAWLLILGVVIGSLASAANDSFKIYFGESGRMAFVLVSVLVSALCAFLILRFMHKV